jgi:hypothetical protein
MENSPILIVRMPHSRTESEVSDVFMDFQESPIMDEYHVLVIKDYVQDSTEIQFEIVNSTFTEIQFEKLKIKLLKEMESAQLNRYKNKSKDNESKDNILGQIPG